MVQVKKERSNRDEMMSTGEAARILAVGANTIRKWIDRGLFPPGACVTLPSGHRRVKRTIVELLAKGEPLAEIKEK